MVDSLKYWMFNKGINIRFAHYLSRTTALIVIILLSFIVNFITKKFILGALKKYIKKTPNKWDDVLLENGIFEQIANIAPAIVIYISASIFLKYESWIQRIVFSYIVLIIIMTLNKLLGSADYIYRKYEISKTKPIKGYIQVVQIFMSIMGMIIIISALIERSPLILLSGIGAATAVLLLIFQNSILGLVASIQLSTNNMVKIGDWISMPKYDADGDVLDISLHTVKVQNWDKTIVTIPTYALVSESFTNWRGMQESGGRRIKRHIYIDMTSIQFCTEEMLQRYKKIEYIQEYLDEKEREIKRYNQEQKVNRASIVNGRHLTNIGTFRAYVEQYLKNHPHTNKNMLQIVRQLQPTEKGLPLEIYTFSDDITWANYEGIQADIFDHILSIIPQFDLRVFQSPMGYDLRKNYNI